MMLPTVWAMALCNEDALGIVRRVLSTFRGEHAVGVIASFSAAEDVPPQSLDARSRLDRGALCQARSVVELEHGDLPGGGAEKAQPHAQSFSRSSS